MKWNKYTIETTTAAEDYMSAMLADLGIEGVEIEDNIPLSKEDQADMFIDFLPELPPDDGVSHVSFYLEDNGEDYTELLKQVKIALEDLRKIVDVGSGVITSDQTEDLDWINNWKKFFSSFYIEDILIKPTWEELKEEDKDKFLIEIDPGVSFGTGKHETTQLCIRQLLKYIRGNAEYTPENKTPKVLDVGCGSGILSIVALKLGASEVVGTDLDPDCMTSTHENFEVNHLDSRLGTFYVGNLIDDVELQEKVGTEEYDIVVANILADVIIPMAPVIPARLKKGGYFITSGIIDIKEYQVKEEIEKAGHTVVEINHQCDKMELIIQKAVELGVYEIIPVAMKNCVVKLDAKKAAAKTARWQGIAESAAKQSKRSLIPKVSEPVSYKEAVAYAMKLDQKLVPYENERGMAATREAVEAVRPGAVSYTHLTLPTIA